VAIQPVTPDLSKSFGLPDTSGALVSSVMDGSPAQKVGMHQGDVIVRYGGRPVARASDLPRAVAETPVGREVPVEVLRDGKHVTLNVKVARLEDKEEHAASAEPASAKLGIAARSLTPALAQQLGVDEQRGVLVEDVEDGGRAQQAGLARGDVIVEVDHQPVGGVDALQNALKRHPAGRPVLLLVHREGNSLYLTVPA
jgi:serine protease Do